ncbi:hypothetical protein ACQBAU_03985 [Propionibacteriaceae bacterium Y2011]
MVPARIGYGQTPVTGVCFNRRYRRTDGLVECNPGAGRDDLVGPAGPVDPLVTGLLVEDRRGTTIGFWSNLAVHYVGTGSQHSISSDYFGAVGERLRRLVGGDVSVQLTNGCSGDINNVDLHGGVPEAGMARAELAATAVAGAVAAGTMMAPRHTSAPLSAGIVGVEVDRMAVTERDRAIARAFLAGERQDTPYSFVVGAPIQPGARRYFAEMLPVLAELPERATVPVQVIMVGELCVVGLPGEIFVEHGLVIKDRSRSPVTAVVGLAGDHIGYVPTLRATAEGGYETWRNAVSWTAPGTGERLVDAAVDLITELTKIRSTASTG